MKISENRRLRGEKKALKRHAHQERQNSGQEKKFWELARAIAEGENAKNKIDFTQTEKILKQASKTPEDLQEAVEECRLEILEEQEGQE